MSDMMREIEEELRRERLLLAWRKYRAYVIATVVAVVLTVAGSTGWRAWTEKRDARATGELLFYVEAISKAKHPDEIAEKLNQYAAKAPGGLAPLARFYQAGALLEARKKAEALAVYSDIAQDHHVSQNMRDLAVLLSASRQLDTQAPDMRATLVQQLQPLTDDASPWRFSAREMVGYLQLTGADKEGGIKTLQALANATDAPESLRQRVRNLLAVYGGRA